MTVVRLSELEPASADALGSSDPLVGLVPDIPVGAVRYNAAFEALLHRPQLGVVAAFVEDGSLTPEVQDALGFGCVIEAHSVLELRSAPSAEQFRHLAIDCSHLNADVALPPALAANDDAWLASCAAMVDAVLWSDQAVREVFPVTALLSVAAQASFAPRPADSPEARLARFVPLIPDSESLFGPGAYAALRFGDLEPVMLARAGVAVETALHESLARRVGHEVSVHELLATLARDTLAAAA